MRRTAVKTKLFVGCLAAVLMSSAWAGLFEDEDARRAILDLRQQIDAMKRDDSTKRDLEQKLSEEVRRSTDDGAQLRRSLFELQNQLETLRAELAKLRGQDEQIARDVGEMQRRQKDALQATDDRFRQLEPVKVILDGREFIADRSEKKDYDAGLAIFRKGDFAQAQVAFVEFLTRYSQTGYRPSALFWLGTAQYASKDYKEAMTNFRSLVTLAPEHIRAPEALLAIANCQQEIKDSKGARKTLEEIVDSYPSSEAAAAAKDRLGRLK